MAIFNVMYGTKKIAFATLVVYYPKGAYDITCTNSYGYRTLSNTSTEFYLDFPTGSTQECLVTVKFSGVTRTSTETGITQNSTRNVNLTYFKREFFTSGSGQFSPYFSNGRGNPAYTKGSYTLSSSYITLGTTTSNQSIACWPNIMLDMTGWKYIKMRYSRQLVADTSNYKFLLSQASGDSFYPQKSYSYDLLMPYESDTRWLTVDVSSLWGYWYYFGPYIYTEWSDPISLLVYDLYLETQ